MDNKLIWEKFLYIVNKSIDPQYRTREVFQSLVVAGDVVERYERNHGEITQNLIDKLWSDQMLSRHHLH